MTNQTERVINMPEMQNMMKVHLKKKKRLNQGEMS